MAETHKKKGTPMKRLSLRLNGATVVAVATLGLAFAMCSFANGPNITESASVANNMAIEGGPWCGELTTAEAFDVVFLTSQTISASMVADSYIADTTSVAAIQAFHLDLVMKANANSLVAPTSEGGLYDVICPITAAVINSLSTDATGAQSEGSDDAILHDATSPLSVAMTMSSA